MHVLKLTLLSCGLILAGCSSPPAGVTFRDDAPANRPTTAAEFTASFVDADGNPVDLKSYRGRPLVLVVVRGMPESPGGVFCPFCLAQVGSLTANYEQFRSRGAEVLLVYPGPSDRAAEFGRQVQARPDAAGGIPYPVCLDKDCSACDRLGIRGDLAKPSTFVFDREGEVTYAYVGKSPSDRPSVKAMLAVLDRLPK